MNNDNIFKTKTKEELHKLYSDFLKVEETGVFDIETELHKIKQVYEEKYGLNSVVMIQVDLTHAICDMWYEENAKERILLDTEVKTFERYIEDDDMPTAFGNSDWCRIYRKIVGQHDDSEKIRGWMKN